MKFRGVIPRAHFPRNFGGTLDTLVVSFGQVHRHALIRTADPDPAGHLASDRLAARDGEDSLDRCRVGRVDAFEPSTDRPTGHCDRRTCESPSIGRIDLRSEVVESVGLVSEQLGLSNEDGNEVASCRVVHLRKQIESNAVAQEGTVRVARVLERDPAESRADFERFAAPNAEQGVENAPRRSPEAAHPGESVEPCSSQEIDDHGFGAVVRSVTRAHVLGKDGVASRARTRFEIGSGFDTDAVRDECCAHVIGGACNSFDFFIGSGSQTVIDMNGSDVEPGGSGEREQCKRVGSPRDCTRKGATGSGECAALDECREERRFETVDEASRFGYDSALVVTAALTPTGIAIRSDLLQISTAESGNGQKTDNRQHDPDPPVPHIRRKHADSVAV